MSTGPKAPEVQLDASVKTVAKAAAQEPLKEVRVWNTKKLGLRLAVDSLCGFTAASSVAPIITVIDKGIMQNASGQATLGQSLKQSFIAFLRAPQSLVFSKPFALICMLYGGTYLSANTLDTLTSTVQNKSINHVTSGTTKFAVTSTTNVGLCLIKDRAFVKMFGSGGPPRPVPLPSYAMFTLRDCMTIFASFNIPPLLGPKLTESLSDEIQKTISGQTIAQFLAPAGIQLLSTPLHLLGLDLYNRPSTTKEVVTWKQRAEIVRKNWSVSSVARMCRIMPAFGIGGVVNKKMREGLMKKLE